VKNLILVFSFILSSLCTVSAEETGSLYLAGHVFPTAAINLIKVNKVLSKVEESNTLNLRKASIQNQAIFLETNFNSSHSHKVKVDSSLSNTVKIEQKKIHTAKNKQIHFFKLSGLKNLPNRKVTLVVMAN